MPADIGFAIVGCGDIARVRYLPAFARLDGGSLVAVCDGNPDLAASALEEFRARRFHADYRELLDAEDVDAVIVTLPHRLHAQVAIDFLRAGKHVLVEKPMATNARDARRMRDVSIESGRVLFPMPHAYSAILEHAKSAIEEGAVGQVCQAAATVCHSGPRHAGWFYQKEIAHHGVLMDLGIYPVTTMVDVFGMVSAVSGTTKTFITSREGDAGAFAVDVEDSATATLEFVSSRVIGTVMSNWCTGVGKNNVVSSLAFHGTGGIMVVDVAANRGWVCNGRGRGRAVRIPGFGGAGFVEFPPGRRPGAAQGTFAGAPILADFVTAIRAGAPVPWVDSAVHAIEVIDKAYAAAETNSRQEVTAAAEGKGALTE